MKNFEQLQYVKELLKKGKYNKAYDIMTELYKVESNSKLVKYEYGRVAIAAKKYETARNVLESIAYDKKWIKALFELAKLDAKENKIEDALDKFSTVLMVLPDDIFTQYEIAKIKSYNGQREEAYKILKKLSKSNIGDLANTMLGYMYYNDGRYEECIKCLLSVEKTTTHDSINKKHSRYKYLADSYIQLNNEIEALKYYTKLYNLGMDNESYELCELARLYKRKNDSVKAEELLKEVLDKDSSYGHALFQLSIIRKEQKKYEEALDLLDKINDEKLSEKVSVERANNLLLLNKKEESREIYYDLWKRYNNKEAIKKLIKIEAFNGDLQKSLDYSIAYLKENFDIDVYYEMGKCYKNIKQYEEAEQIFEYCLDIKAYNDIYLELIYTKIGLQKYEEARYLLDKYILNNPENLNKEISNVIYYLDYIQGNRLKNPTTFFQKNLVKYDIYKVKEHIRNHLNENDEKKNHTVFNKNIDINKIYTEVKNKIKKVEKYSSNLCDKCIVNFDYPISNINGKDIYDVEVVCYANTNDIITMYPYVLLDDEVELDKPIKKQVKKISRIEMFNKKYGLNK